MDGPRHVYIDLDRPGVWLDIDLDTGDGAIVRAVLYDDDGDAEFAAQIAGRLGVPAEPS